MLHPVAELTGQSWLDVAAEVCCWVLQLHCQVLLCQKLVLRHWLALLHCLVLLRCPALELHHQVMLCHVLPLLCRLPPLLHCLALKYCMCPLCHQPG